MDTTRNVEEFFKNVQAECKKMNNYTTDWQQVRIQAAIAAMQGLLSNEKQVHIKVSEAAYMSVLYADALVEELKGE